MRARACACVCVCVCVCVWILVIYFVPLLTLWQSTTCMCQCCISKHCYVISKGSIINCNDILWSLPALFSLSWLIWARHVPGDTRQHTDVCLSDADVFVDRYSTLRGNQKNWTSVDNRTKTRNDIRLNQLVGLVGGYRCRQFGVTFNWLSWSFESYR